MSEKIHNWTPQQLDAIETRGRNLLVAASAGTGKTAVLVERCIRMIVDPERPIDVDRLLVVTFTDAAASEMRNRISEALRKRLDANPADTRLRRQIVLLDRASISTLHAFALHTLQEHFFRLGLDPDLDVIDPEEAQLLRAETLEQVFEELYSTADGVGPKFRRLVGRYGAHGEDDPVRRTVVTLSNFLRSLPWPERRREEILNSYDAVERAARFEDLDWYGPFRLGLGEALSTLISDLREAAKPYLYAQPLPAPCADYFRERAADFAQFVEALETKGYDVFRERVQEYKYPTFRMPNGMDETLKKEIQERNKKIRDAFRNKIVGDWCGFDGGQWIETLRHTREGVETLFELVRRFDEAYHRAKRERGEVDFHDLERFCLQLLLDERSTPECPLPSEAAREIRDKYEEVLVDEYQDISPLQDAILALCSRQDGDERAPNLFMVGDVKQSIYRFRLADPDIFLQKFRDYREQAYQARCRRVDLNHNFRSRLPLLGALNKVFRLVMIPEVGGIEYDESAELRGGFDYPEPGDVPPPGTGLPIEVHFFEREKRGAAADETPKEPSKEHSQAPPVAAGDEGASEEGEGEESEYALEVRQIQIEAAWVAQRIHDMVAEAQFSVWDSRAQRYRPVTYSDIAVLLSTAEFNADIFVRTMRERGVPAFTESRTGLFRATETRDLLNLLELLDNPHQDIPLAGVLRSPLAGIDENALALVRIHSREGLAPNEQEPDFFSAAARYAESGPDKRLRARLAEFLERLDRWRTLARRGPLAQAVWAIYDETGYLDYATAMTDGAQRRANLIGLYDRARQFDEFSRRGLSRFLEFIRRLDEAEGELGAAPALTEAGNVVRVMTIHKSKGLEFPVVFVPDIGKRFNFQNAAGDLVVDREKGIALRDVDLDRGYKFPSMAHLVIGRHVEQQIRAEQLRLLYVAATRARERLIFCGSIDGLPNQRYARFARPFGVPPSGGPFGVPPSGGPPKGGTPNGPVGQSKSGEPRPLDAVTVGSARSFADWIGAALARLGYISENALGPATPSREEFLVHQQSTAEWRDRLSKPVLDDQRDPRLRDIAVLKKVPAASDRPDLIDHTMRCLTWRYRWEALSTVRGKFPVTELKSRFERDDEVETRMPQRSPLASIRPKFLASEPTPAEIGTATHTVLYHINLKQPIDAPAIDACIADMVERCILTKDEGIRIELPSILRFFESEIGRAMRRNPERVLREWRFTRALPLLELDIGDVAGGEIAPDIGDVAEGENVCIQGTIDCLIESNAGFHIVDYKTNRIDAHEAAALAQHYRRTQLDPYAQAVEAILKRRVTARTVYFLHPGLAISI
jgi:ATP-dependent helicase/nuclease subunit A